MLQHARRVRWMGVPVLALALAFLLPASAPTLHAQAPAGAGVNGTVLDPDSKAVVNAAVVIRNEATGATVATTTDGSGKFTASGLPQGSYAVEVFVPGFEAIRRAGVQVKEGAATTVSIQLSVANISETVTVSAALPAAAVAAPSQGSLTARSAQSLISAEYIQNYTSPISDYSQVLQMAPGTFSVAANGPGLGDTKTFFRGFKDGQYSMTYDSIPFNDTNDPTHHSWAFFPAQTIGSTVFDRSPGSAQTIGPSTYGGSVSLLSRSLNSERLLNGTISYGSFNTKLFDMDFNTGRFGSGGKQRLMFDLHDMRSDGYQTFNFQHRVAFSAKYNYQLSDNSSISALTSIMHLSSNTPNQKGSTRAQYAAVRRQLPDDRQPERSAVLQVQLLLDSDRLRVLRLPDAVRQRLVDRRQGLHDAVLQQAELQRRDRHLGDQRHRQVEQLSQVRQQPAGHLRGKQRDLPHRSVVGIRLDGSLSDSVGSAHLG